MTFTVTGVEVVPVPAVRPNARGVMTKESAPTEVTVDPGETPPEAPPSV